MVPPGTVAASETRMTMEPAISWESWKTPPAEGSAGGVGAAAKASGPAVMEARIEAGARNALLDAAAKGEHCHRDPFTDAED